MYTINGFGTTFYGSDFEDPMNDSYITTKWFVIFYLPIIPLESMRVIRLDDGGWWGSDGEYKILRMVPLNKKQILRTYLLGWGVPMLVMTLISSL